MSEINVIKFEQLANFSDEEIALVDDYLKLGGRMEREDWPGQALKLMAETTAGEVRPSRKQPRARQRPNSGIAPVCADFRRMG